jgi:LacI family transcriptional regulator, galactose operon repressor
MLFAISDRSFEGEQTPLTGQDDRPLAAPRRQATMREVAALAGVSLKTVSRVVNREGGVSPALDARVERAVKLLDYRHDVGASSLRRSDRRTATIGLLLDDVANPFSSAIHRAIEDVARARDILVFAGSNDAEPERQERLIHELVSRRVDGLIVVPAGRAHAALLRARDLGRPIVFIDRRADFDDADSVMVDNRAGARAATRHLAAHGHRRIAFLGDLRTIWTAAERHLGYLDGLAAVRLPLEPRWVRDDIHSSAAAEQATRELLASEEAPSALFTGQNLITIGAIRALQALGRQHDIALIGFDDVLLADLLDPPISVVAQDPTAIGKTAAELLFARLDGDSAAPQQIVVPTRLIPRGSGEIPAM